MKVIDFTSCEDLEQDPLDRLDKLLTLCRKLHLWSEESDEIAWYLAVDRLR